MMRSRVVAGWLALHQSPCSGLQAGVGGGHEMGQQAGSRGIRMWPGCVAADGATPSSMQQHPGTCPALHRLAPEVNDRLLEGPSRRQQQADRDRERLAPLNLLLCAAQEMQAQPMDSSCIQRQATHGHSLRASKLCRPWLIPAGRGAGRTRLEAGGAQPLAAKDLPEALRRGFVAWNTCAAQHVCRTLKQEAFERGFISHAGQPR